MYMEGSIYLVNLGKGLEALIPVDEKEEAK
jgi:hypothetical protein